jgi:pimeloyl-ACP methyl ester carboxylesterase
MSDSDVVPFKVDIPRSEVDRLKRKLQDTRLPPKKIVPEAGNKYGRIAVQIHIHRTNHLLTFNLTGPTYEWVRDLYTAWLDYDWYSVQDQINEFPHYTTRIEDVKLHFVHARSDRKDAIPLIMCHGWPGSFWEFSSVWGPLSHPSDPKDPAFHVVVPSLPGFCFSDWPPRAGWRLQDTARLFDQLMKRLGYEEYMRSI